MQKFVSLDSVDSDDPSESLRSQLQRAGIPAPVAVARLLAAGLAPYQETRQYEHFVTDLVQRFKRFISTSTSIGEDAALLVVALAAVDHNLACAHSKDDERVYWDVSRRLFDHLIGAVGDLTAAFAAVRHSRDVARVMRLPGIASALCRRGLLEPARMIDRELLRSLEPAQGGRHWEIGGNDLDPARLEYWCKVELSAVVPACFELMEREPLETLGALARGIGIQLSLSIPGPPPIDLDALCRVLCRRRRLEGAEADQLLTSACWRFVSDLGGGAPHVLPDDYEELSESAFAALGRMRTLFQGDDAAQRFAVAQDYLDAAMFFVLRTQPKASLWDVLRRLLLAMRALPAPGVPSDLRTWGESGKHPVPMPWFWVPERIARVFQLYLTRELELDPELKKLRMEFARFCLDRVKSKEKAEPGAPLQMVEPDPHWRMAYILAARELHAALGARGHRVLVWSKNNDPEPRVREAADVAEDVVRREQALPENKSPRRAVFAAFWWLRQAHVLALGGNVDEVEARETFRKEVRRQART